MFRNIIEVQEPASSDQYIGVARQREKIRFPDVSSCMVIVFKLENSVIIGGHVPMIWGKESSFNLLENTKKVISEMKNLVEGNYTGIILIGDKSNWNSSDSGSMRLGSKIAETALDQMGLREVPHLFYDKEKMDYAVILADNHQILVSGKVNESMKEETIHYSFPQKNPCYTKNR